MTSNSNVLSDQRSACHQLTSSKLDWILEVEKVSTFTLNTHYLEDYKTKFEAKYKILRHEKTEYGNVIRVLTCPDRSDAKKSEDLTPVEDAQPPQPKLPLGPSANKGSRPQPINSEFNFNFPSTAAEDVQLTPKFPLGPSANKGSRPQPISSELNFNFPATETMKRDNILGALRG